MASKVSVIIPCYNHGEFLTESIDSIKNQSYSNIEIIVINDGSTDEKTLDVLNTLNHREIKLYSIENVGLPSARNYGIKKACGDYILTLDADDLFKSTFLEKGVTILDENEEIGIVSSYIEAFGEFSSVNKKFKSGGVEHFISENNTVSCALFRKKCWVEAGGYNANMDKGMEDWDFWVNVTSRGWKVEIIPEILFLYRQHKSSMSTETTLHRPRLFTQIVLNNRGVFEKHLETLAYEKELKIAMLKKDIASLLEREKYYKNQTEKYRDSASYRIGNNIITFFGLIRKKNTR